VIPGTPGSPAGEERGPKRSIALVIAAPSGDGEPGARPRWLVVQRPFDDEDLPGAWGLPAGSFAPGETGEELVRRIGRQKLGVELRPDRPLASGRAERTGYRLEMTLWAAAIETGTVEVPRPVRGITQYRDWGWRPPAALRPGAARGSLCCRLGLALSGEV